MRSERSARLAPPAPSLASSPAASALKRTTEPAPPELPGFAPWPLPAALSLALGVVLAGLGLPLWTSVLATLLVALGLLWWRGAQVALLALSLLVPLGAWRYAHWQTQPHLLEPLMAQRLTVSGESDGRYLRVESVDGDARFGGARVVLSPRGAVAPGRMTLQGDLAEAQGKRNPGGFDYRGYLERRGVRGQLFVREVIEHEAAAVSLRERLRQGVTAGLGAREGALMQAMTLGLREDLGDLREVFARSGLAHLLALSGLHVGVLMAALGLALKGLGAWRYPFMILFVWGFVWLVGPTPSVVRAAAMVTAVLLTLWLGSGRIEPWPALGLAALGTLLWNPSWLFDLSFQLSYLAVAGILLLAGQVMTRLFGPGMAHVGWWDPRKLIIGAAVLSASAQALTLPLVAHHFGSLPLLSPLVNVVAVPLASLLVPLGFLAGLLGTVSPGLAGALNALTAVVAGALLALADVAAALPTLLWGEIAATGYALYAVAMTALVLALWGKLRPWRAALVVSAALACTTVLAAREVDEIVVFDVGQGDSALVRARGAHILVDGGGSVWSDFDVGGRIVVPALRALGVRRLDLVVATHAHIDHMEGLVSVLEMMPVGALLIGVEDWEREVFADLMETAKRNRVPVVQVTRGESLLLGALRLEILNPPRRRYGNVDADSVAFALYLDDAPVALFLGDIPEAVERELAFPDVVIMMAPHHGSKTSSSEMLVRAARPEKVIISYGRNNYGHPSPLVLARLEAAGAVVRETFLEGAVRVPIGR